ncbi:MAG: hypothetical protein AAB909_02335 [Patescibacteria group bacterium]
MKIKTNKFIVTILILSFMLVSTSSARAEENKKPPIAEKIKVNMENRLEKNREIRNVDIARKNSSSSPMLRDEKAKLLKATSTPDRMIFKRTQENRENKENKEKLAKTMQTKVFETRKKALTKELSIAIKNLDNIAIRIQSRITKAETSGKDMTQAKTLFIEAQNLLATAKVEVAAFEALNITSSTNTTASTTAEVELTKPRTLGDAAIKSVKAARDAMHKVVVAIARGMELRNATTTNN